MSKRQLGKGGQARPGDTLGWAENECRRAREREAGVERIVEIKLNGDLVKAAGVKIN